jgi:DNA-binding phage protein
LVEVFVKIVVEINVPGLEALFLGMVKKRSSSADRLASGLKVSRETVRRLLSGSHRSQLSTVLAVCGEIDFDPKKLKALLLKGLREQDFQIVADGEKISTSKKDSIRRSNRKKTKVEKSISGET